MCQGRETKAARGRYGTRPLRFLSSQGGRASLQSRHLNAHIYIYIHTININHQIAQLVAAFHQVILASTLSSEEQQRLRRALEVPRTEAVAPVPRDDGNMLFYPRSPIFVCFQRGFFGAMFLHVVFFAVGNPPDF